MTVSTSADTVTTSAEFIERWRFPPNFRVAVGLFHPEFVFPDGVDLLDAVRRDEEARVTILGEYGRAVRTARSLAFGRAPIEEVVSWPFRLAHFNLARFYGGFLRDFQAQVMIPWRVFLASHGFTWQRCYPILFISAQGCSSTYHADNSHGLVWQVEGVKRFNSFVAPEQYAPVEAAIRGTIVAEQPACHEDIDLLSMQMRPGDTLWSHILTPHWVTAESSPLTVSINISHGGLMHQGRCADREVALRRYWDENPAEAWLGDLRNARY